jgi:vesicle-fusing ATPase
MSYIHRRWASLSLNQEVSVAPYDPSFETQYHYLGDIELEVGFLQKNQDPNEQFDTVEMSNIFCQVLPLHLHFKDYFYYLTNA